MRFVLDTNTCIYALKLEGRVVERLRDHTPDDLGVAIITVAELWFGAHKSSRPAAVRREMDGFLEPFEVLPFDRDAAEAYARSRLALERIGRPMGERDLLIASIALARELTVVTHNASEFGRVPGLKTEDWLVNDFQAETTSASPNRPLPPRAPAATAATSSPTRGRRSNRLSVRAPNRSR